MTMTASSVHPSRTSKKNQMTLKNHNPTMKTKGQTNHKTPASNSARKASPGESLNKKPNVRIERNSRESSRRNVREKEW